MQTCRIWARFLATLKTDMNNLIHMINQYPNLLVEYMTGL
jgi:hypothetical protein